MVTKAKIIQSSNTKKKAKSVKQTKANITKQPKTCKTNCLQPFMKRNLIILVALIILVGAILIVTHLPNKDTQVDMNMTVVATVNDEALYQYEVDNYWNMLSAEQKLQIEKDNLIQELINQKLLLQRAQELNISTSSEEAETILEMQIIQQGANYSDYLEWLESQNLELADVLQTLAEQTTLSKLLEQDTDTINTDISQEEINTYYEENKEQFTHEEQMTVQHILILSSEEVNETVTEELVTTIEAELDSSNNKNFCELVTQYSGDIASREKCGEYTFSKGAMVPEFENAAWTMNVGERRTVESNYGFHIMLKIQEHPQGTYTLSDAVPGMEDYTFEKAIGNVLLETKAKVIFNDYIEELKKDSEIVF